MATTVINAFNVFQKDVVNLDSDESKKATKSRDWLLKQIVRIFDSKRLPILWEDMTLFYGSFSRRTKIRKLDDIDIMICLSGSGGKYYTYDDYIEIRMPDNAQGLSNLCNEGSDILNSRRVINKFVSELSNVEHYKSADIKRNQEAAVLNLVSYDWKFDIVPCFYTTEESDGRCYYLIPDGEGNWKKTDPRIDQERVTNINQNNSGNLLNIIRITKYWQRIKKIPTMSSYLLECIILNYYESKTNALNYVDLELINILLHISTAVLKDVKDPKGIQGNTNQLSEIDRLNISIKALSDHIKAQEARTLEENDKIQSSINKWREVLGSEFPEFV